MNKKRNTKYEILQHATRLFIEKGYTDAYVTSIANDLGISTGNLTFHFPTKEHILAEMIKALCTLPKRTRESLFTGKHAPLEGYLLELAIIASVCRDYPNIKDLMVNAYTRSMPLEIIRKSDTERAKQVFGAYHTNWTEEEYIQTQNVVSGIEYAMFMTENTEKLSFEQRLTGCLNAIMKVYDIPEGIRKHIIADIMALDYRSMGKQVFLEFCDYVERKKTRG